MRAVVRYFHSPDADLDTFVPVDDTDVGLLVQAVLGPDDGPGEESFDVMACTPRWLRRWVGGESPLMGRHHLIVERWDALVVQQYLTAAFEREEAGTWMELGNRLGRIGKWEFEDYQEHGS